MEGKLIVTVVTRGCSDDIADLSDGRSVRDEIEGCAGVIRIQIELGQISVAVNANRMRCRPIKTGRRLRIEFVSVFPVGNRGERAVGISGSLLSAGYCGTARRSRGVGNILILGLRNRGCDKT